MIDFPTSSVQGVTSVRPALNEVERRVSGGTAEGKTAAHAQIVHFLTTGFSAKENQLYPTTDEPLAQSIRSKLSEVARHIARQSASTRTAIAGQLAAFVDALGVTVPAALPAAPVALVKAATEGAVVTFSLDAEVPGYANIYSVSWFVDGVFVPMQDGVALSITAPADLTTVIARLHSVAGTVDVTWTVTTTPAPLFADQSPLNGVRVQVNVADGVTKQQLSALSKADLVKVLNGELVLADAIATL